MCKNSVSITVEVVLCLWTPVSVLRRLYIVILTVVEVLWMLRLCDARELLFQCWKDHRFHCRGGPVHVVQASFSSNSTTVEVL